jgi:DNA-binding SARP family transcriptional activator
MARLSVHTLGPFQVALGSEPVTSFESDKVRALLAYLSVEWDRPHRRESLAGLLWPSYPEHSARTNLRSALANLRQAIGDSEADPPFLHVSRQAIQFNGTSDAWVDAAAFSRYVEAKGSSQQSVEGLEQAVRVYRGSFLEGFSLADSPAFEEWALLKRERLHRLVTDALRQLVAFYGERGDHGVALGHARRLLELNPLMEAAHRQVMRLLLHSGERGAALAQYEVCRRLLATELDAKPSQVTERLYRQIRAGKLEVTVTAAYQPGGPMRLPSFLQEAAVERAERPVFVAREPELARLERYLEQARAGQGGIAFITGGPGRGKTILMREFAQRAMQTYPDLLVANGHGNAYAGVGDPYLPFRKVLDMLSGDVEAQWAAGAIDPEHALRLWHGLPLAARALVELGPELIDTFLPGRALVARAMAHIDAQTRSAGWLARLEELVEREAGPPPNPNLQQSALFKQYARVLGALAQQRPLLLILDDLQWVDVGSAGLLFHLGRELPGGRILILGAYRPEEVALGRAGERHPLEGLLAEFKRRFGDVWLDLSWADRMDGRHFVDALLDSAPNRLGERFRNALFRRTEGHPLFTAELLRAMQERGNLVREAGTEGAWVAGTALDWGTLPPRVEGVIAERIDRLEAELREMLRVASVEGEQFTAQVIARVLGVEERRVMRQLSEVLERRHRLVSAQGTRRLDGQRLSLHRFQHNLFQKYLYNNTNAAERAYLHRDVGNALEGLYLDHPEELAAAAPQLARHFQEAGITQKAIDYLRQAGERAARMSANPEAVAHYTQALKLLATLPETSERIQQELMLQVGLIVPLQVIEGYGTLRLGRALTRAQELCGQVGETPQLFQVLWLLTSFRAVRGEYSVASETGEQLLNMARLAQDPVLELLAREVLALALILPGEFSRTRAHLEHAIQIYEPQQHHFLAHLYGADPGVLSLSWLSQVLWFLGYPDQALKRSQEALDLAQQLAHPTSLAFAQVGAGGQFFQFCRDARRCQEWAMRCMKLSSESGLPLYLAGGTVMHGWALTEQGQVKAGIAQIREGIAIHQTTGSAALMSLFLTVLAKAYGTAGMPGEGLASLAEASAVMEKTGERYCEAEIQRVKGELLRMQGADAGEVEPHYRKALQVAREQSAKSWELRATLSLARLWQMQGKIGPAREMLGEVYGWFTEGFDTADLQEARMLLDELQCS